MICRTINLPGGGRAIVCGPRVPQRYCACGKPAPLLCDWKVKGKRSGTCDRPICAYHAREVETDKHLCPEHQVKHDEWLASRRAGQT